MRPLGPGFPLAYGGRAEPSTLRENGQAGFGQDAMQFHDVAGPAGTEGEHNAQRIATRVDARELPRRAALTMISTSRPRAFKNRSSRSMEKPSSFPRTNAETLG